jgi:serine/threonine-protein kinase
MECDPVFFDRFQREKQIGQEMDHPAVVKVLRDEDPSRVYMVMEWVDGKLLREFLKPGEQFPAPRAVRITLGVLDGLEYIHSHGIVHRDLKPDNIMLGDRDNVKLIDFGIAGKSGARRLTFGKFSHLSGTPDYISPEQVKGKRGDPRSDVYAVGVILYEMLTGRAPFEGLNPLAVINQRLRDDPAPVREVAPEVSPALEEILKRALERDPRHRYATAREFAWDLTHQDKVGITAREVERRSGWGPVSLLKRILIYSGLAAIPASIFGLLLYVASHA